MERCAAELNLRKERARFEKLDLHYRSQSGTNGTGRSADFADNASSSQSEDLRIFNRTQVTEILAAIDQALRRLGTEVYGFCTDCQDRIPDNRLQAIPWARTCTKCANENSRMSRLGSPSSHQRLVSL